MLLKFMRFSQLAELPIQGKEADWIDGDYILQNRELVAVIARPGSLRDANMTVRGVGACIIDLTRRDQMSDQLSCFYPGAGRYRFHDGESVQYGVRDDGEVFWRYRSSSSVANDGSYADLEYSLGENDHAVKVVDR